MLRALPSALSTTTLSLASTKGAGTFLVFPSPLSRLIRAGVGGLERVGSLVGDRERVDSAGVVGMEFTSVVEKSVTVAVSSLG